MSKGLSASPVRYSAVEVMFFDTCNETMFACDEFTQKNRVIAAGTELILAIYFLSSVCLCFKRHDP